IGDLTTRRPLPGPALDLLDPFLFLNHHGPQTYPPNNHGLPFGPHPHRGFETVTFILDGELAHRDSGGHESIITAGGVQWMTAGSGLVHAELSPEAFMRRGGGLEILQLWVNLPARLKMTAPKYTGLQAADIPSFVTDEGRVTIEPISGTWDGHAGPIDSPTDVQMAVLRFAPRGHLRLPVARGRTIFLYVVRGSMVIGGTGAEAFHLVELNDDGDMVELGAATDAVVLFGHAPPFNEPVVAHGPFVMNTREEIIQAIRDYQAGKFGGMA
ncbi:MAG TPA: pirin family protein, partial [Acetobacteraceae bacterium]|nr:pirin family protein [Acetobacteraceae bacterium]